MIWLLGFAVLAASVVLFFAADVITGLRVKVRELEKELARLEKECAEESALSLREVVVFTNDGHDYPVVIDMSLCDKFAAEFLLNSGHALIAEKAHDKLPWPLGSISYGEIVSIEVRMPSAWRLRATERCLVFDNGRIVWLRWGELVRSLMRDLAFPFVTPKPLTPEEFAMLIDGDLRAERVAAWAEYKNSNDTRDCRGLDYREFFQRIRECLDESELVFKKLMQRPTLRQFMREVLPGTSIPVLELLKTDKGMEQVRAYIEAVRAAGTTYLESVAKT